MDIERLKELKSWVSDLRKFGVSEGNEIIVLIDEAIARQSIKSEDVQVAIEWVTNTRHGNQYMSGDWTAPMYNHINRTIQDTIITALQSYKPTTRKNRTVEPAAIPKTETTSCEWCEGNVSKYFDTNWYNFTAKNTGVRPKENYCPNCGRKLKED